MERSGSTYATPSSVLLTRFEEKILESLDPIISSMNGLLRSKRLHLRKRFEIING